MENGYGNRFPFPLPPSKSLSVIMVSMGKMETETELRFPRGKWKRKLVSVAENGNEYQFPFRSLPPSKSLSVVNSEKNYPAKKMRVDLPVEDRRG